MKQLLSNEIYVGISKYSDSFMIVINQTGTIGSLVFFYLIKYKGRYAGEVLPEIGE